MHTMCKYRLTPFITCILAIDTVTTCVAEADDVWQIQWPFTPVGDTSVVPCGANFTGKLYEATIPMAYIICHVIINPWHEYTVRVMVCTCVSDYFSDTVSLYVKIVVPMAWVGHGLILK